MNILLIGHGAREHAIAEAFSRSQHKPVLFSYMKSNNPGISSFSSTVILGEYNDLAKIEQTAKKAKVDFVFIGPEDPLNNGVVDVLEEAGISCIGPSKKLAQLETSKSFTRNLLKKYIIPGNPQSESFQSLTGIKKFMDSLSAVVIKPDGLTGGKGVKVQGDHFQTKEEGISYCKEVLNDHSSVIVEEKLEGEEFSLQCFCDGYSIQPMPLVQDHKRAFDGDKGPNTGGMGSYSFENHLLPFLSKKDRDEGIAITQKVCNALREELGKPYKGIMYGGFMATKKGVHLIEYNARFGDPETMNVLPILETDFVEICQSIINEGLGKLSLTFQKKATVCKYAVPQGYPDHPVKNQRIDVSHVPKDAKMYYASADQKKEGLIMSSSRAVAVVGIASSINDAEKIAEHAVSSITGPVFHRKDIGTKALIQKRIDHMKKIRS